MASPKNSKSKNQKLHSRPNDAFLRKYGYTIRPSRSDPRVGVVYDRYGNIVKPAEYQRNVDSWNRLQQTIRQENVERRSGKVGNPQLERAAAGEVQRAKQHRKNEKFNRQVDTMFGGAVTSPSHIVGAVARKLADPDRSFMDLYLLGEDDKGYNAGLFTDTYASEHPNVATLGNLAADLATGVRFRRGTPAEMRTVDTYGYRTLEAPHTPTPQLRLTAGEQSPLLDGRKLPVIHGGSSLEPVGPAFDQPKMLNRSGNIIVRPDGTVVEVSTPHDVGPYRGSGTSVVVPRGPVVDGPIDLINTGSYVETTPGTPGRFGYTMPWYAFPSYYDNMHMNIPDDDYYGGSLPDITVTAPSPKGGGSGKGKTRGKGRTSGIDATGAANTSVSAAEQRIPNNLGPAVDAAILSENRAPDYGPTANVIAHGRKWNPVVDMNGNTIIPGWNIVNGEAVRAQNPGVTDLSYQYVPKDDQETLDRILNEYGFGGVFFI